MKVILTIILGVFFANAAHSQTGLFSYVFTLEGIKTSTVSTYSNYVYPYDTNYNYTKYNTSEFTFTDSFTGGIFSKNILDTLTVSYSWRDRPPPYDYTEFTNTLKFTIDTSKRILPFLLYESDSYTHSARSGGSSNSSLRMINIPYKENIDSSIFLFLTDKEVIPFFYNYSGHGGANGVNGIIQESVSTTSQSNGFDTSKLLFKFLFGKPIASNVVVVSPIKEASFFPNPVSNKLHVKLIGQRAYPTSVQIYNCIMQNVKSINMPTSIDELDISVEDLPNGTYFIKFGSDTYKVFVSK